MGKTEGVYRNIAAVTLAWIRVGTYPNLHTSLHTFIHLDAHPEQLVVGGIMYMGPPYILFWGLVNGLFYSC